MRSRSYFGFTYTPMGYRIGADRSTESMNRAIQDNCCARREGKGRTKDRSPEEDKDLINRLSRIEGQIRGLKRMVEEGAYCPDILNQSAAASAALSSFNRVLMSNHIKSCVMDDIKAGNDETVDELLGVLQKLMK